MDVYIYSFILEFEIYLFSTWYVPDMVLSSGDEKV